MATLFLIQTLHLGMADEIFLYRKMCKLEAAIGASNYEIAAILRGQLARN
jgi:hypothetical protein